MLYLTKEGAELVSGLECVERELEEAHCILRLEDEQSIEGNVAKQARVQLVEVRQALVGLRTKEGL